MPQPYYHDCAGRIPGHTTRAPPVGFELETNGFQLYAIANLDKTSLLIMTETCQPFQLKPSKSIGPENCHPQLIARVHLFIKGHSEAHQPEPQTTASMMWPHPANEGFPTIDPRAPVKEPYWALAASSPASPFRAAQALRDRNEPSRPHRRQQEYPRHLHLRQPDIPA